MGLVAGIELTTIWISMPLVGLVAGLLGGLLGIGGSIVMIPAMTELMGARQHLFQATALIVNYFVAVPAVVQHGRAHAIDPTFVRKAIPIAAVASILGVLCSELPVFRGDRSVYLTGLFGLFLFYVAAGEVRRMLVPNAAAAQSDPTSRDSGWLAAMIVAVPTGCVSGLLGVGGGVLAVPLQRRVLGTNLRTAIANSACVIVGLSLVGAVVKHLALIRNHPEVAWTDPGAIAILLIPTAIVGSWIGGRLTHVLPLRWVRLALVVLLMVAGGRMVSRVDFSRAALSVDNRVENPR